MTAKLPSQSGDQDQTHRSFNDKWVRNPGLAVSQTRDPSSPFNTWIMERNGWGNAEGLRSVLASRHRILDAGCGNGRVTALLSSLAPHAEVVGIDIIELEPARVNTGAFPKVSLVQRSLREPLDDLGRFDFIYCQEVLHHTGDARASFLNLANILSDAGLLAIYVYRQKAPAREFMDDHVRGLISSLPYDEAMVVCRQITELGRRLAEVTGEVTVDDIAALGIEAGQYTPQRLLYNFFLKCYWNPDLSFEENAVINYDWYHPAQCSRHTLSEVRSWFEGAGLRVSWERQDLYGITMHGHS